MKKNLIAFGCSFLIGCGCAYVFLNSFIDKVTYTNITQANAYAFQVGVFQSVEKASEEAKNFSNSIVVKDGDYYRIYLNIAKNEEVKQKLLDYYQSRGIQVYAKKISVSNDFLKTLDNYEKLIVATDDSIIQEVNKDILKSYEAM